jgi:4-amino-4-deoxy-L-arabinose transferase-like glycosyltransferase
MKKELEKKTEPVVKPEHSIFGSSKLARIIVLAFIFLVAFGIRAYDITDLPLDFHPTSQLNRALMARGRYYAMLPNAPEYQKALAIKMWKAEDVEPPFMDGLAALTYLAIGQEVLWVPRLFGALFWLIGGIAVYLLAKEFTSHDTAVISTGIYLFLPFGVIASRTFQPDPLMIAFMLFAWWLMYRWVKKPSWKLSILAGMLAGLSILAKGIMVFYALAGFLGILTARGFKDSIKDLKFWVMGVISVIPTFIYIFYLNFIDKTLMNQLSMRVFPNLWVQPTFYLQWKGMVEEVIGLGLFLLALIGIFLFKDRQQRWFVISFWIGYIVYGFLFAYYYQSHNYYHLPLIPIVALSIAPLIEILVQKISEVTHKRIIHAIFLGFLTIGLAANLWNIRQVFHKTDYRPQVAFWQHIGEVLGKDPGVIALTQDYGYRLEYWGWVMPAGYWPYNADNAMRQLAGIPTPEFNQEFNKMIQNRKYFLVTDMAEYDQQPELKAMLTANYPVYDQGQGYIIYDLLHPIHK